ncbi:MAG: M23 family metallopeptidase [Oscillospiraceae bacterium]|nr:M23 family metallopeptidase [Oscillospiraceae bacterium]
MNKFDRTKKSRLFSRRLYYAALVICLAMVGLACYFSYTQTAEDLSEQINSIGDTDNKTAVDAGNEDSALDVVKKKDNIKKETTMPEAPGPEEKPEAKATKKVFCIPMSGEIMQEYSGSDLVKNITTGAWQTHNGVDIAGNTGDEVRAMTDGTVTDVYEDALWGVVVVIDHGNGITGRYCNLNKGVSVETGTNVAANDVIGAIGDTADIESSMECHLHFEVLKSENYVNPIDVINNMG